jgi:DNA-binding NarL/FixJ family response regulator
LRCLIVDDNARFLVAARTLLEGEEVSIVGVASTGADALRLAAELTPDVVLLDIDLGDESGFDVAQQLVRLDTESPRVVLISTYEESDFRELVAESPAIGFVAKAELSRQAIDLLMAS